MNKLDTYVKVVEKYMLDGGNTFILMKHKHRGYKWMMPSWLMVVFYCFIWLSPLIILKWCCNGFPNA